ncbi:hypothetical protein IQ273_22325 [Nodosilinea sp. LEGE 07298]|nr:hypothetical protein [Nodosilinea sp. LEGE 07298]MBE9112145.1 hypothetical protein [Nodosilinea sp. LEGE 07298]
MKQRTIPLVVTRLNREAQVLQPSVGLPTAQEPRQRSHRAIALSIGHH